jgi:hypothetical protein
MVLLVLVLVVTVIPVTLAQRLTREPRAAAGV